MHAPTCFGKFPCVVGKFSKATPTCKVLLYFLKSFQKLHLPHALQQTGFVFFLEDGRCIPPVGGTFVGGIGKRKTKVGGTFVGGERTFWKVFKRWQCVRMHEKITKK
jgi:hypothetical protein